ncbi:MAG: DNA-3-methyladenine glycosylase [Methanotrichaceae archaeon]
MAVERARSDTRIGQLYSESGDLSPALPFDFSKSIAFIKSFEPMEREQIMLDGSLNSAVSIFGEPIAFRLNAKGTAEMPMLKYTIFSHQPIDSGTKENAIDRIAFFLSIYDDLRPFYEIGEADLHFRPVLYRLHGYHQVKFLTPFEGTCWAILTERNAVPIAKRQRAALAQRIGKRIKVGGVVYMPFPEPDQMLEANIKDILDIIKNKRRTEYLISAAEAFEDVNESFLRHGDYEEVAAWLDAIKGIGSWYASFIMLCSLGRMERAPLHERSLLRAASSAYGRKMDIKSLQDLANRYGRWQGYWAHYLRVCTTFSRRLTAIDFRPRL